MRIKTICSLQTRKGMARAVYETAPTSLELKLQLAVRLTREKKNDTRLLIGRIAFLTCGKSDTQHLIGLHRFANENLLCGFSVCKSQYVYNNSCYRLAKQYKIRKNVSININTACKKLLINTMIEFSRHFQHKRLSLSSVPWSDRSAAFVQLRSQS